MTPEPNTARGPVRHRGLWLAVGVVCVLVAGSVAAAGLAVHAVQQVEVVRVSIDEHGSDPVSIDLALPGALVAAGLAVAPHVMPADARQEVHDQLAEFGPLAAALADDLARRPDFTLVEVDDRGEHVEVLKRGRHLVIRVRSGDADVDVEVPLSLVRRATAAFDV